MFADLEEKRLKLVKAQLERERKMRKEDQNFQLHVMQTESPTRYNGMSVPPYSWLMLEVSPNSPFCGLFLV